MAHPIVHAAATGGIIALFLWKNSKKTGKKIIWRFGFLWDFFWEEVWTRKITIIAIVFFGVLIDLDHYFPMTLPRGTAMQVFSDGKTASFQNVVIFGNVLWMHSVYAAFGALLLQRFCRSYLPLAAFLGHAILDIAFYPGLMSINKPIIKDVFLFLVWLFGIGGGGPSRLI